MSARTTAIHSAPAARTAPAFAVVIPPIAKNGTRRVGGGVAHELQPDRRAAGLGRRRVDRTHPDVVDGSARGGVDLRGTVGREADEPVGADGRARIGHRHVVLPDVDPVGAHRVDQVRPVVER